MAIYYKGVARPNPLNRTAPRKIYPEAEIVGVINLEKLAGRVASTTSFSAVDVHGIALALLKEIPEALKESFKVELGDLCDFYPTVKGKGADSVEALNAVEHVTKKSVRIRPGSKLIKAIQDTPVQKVIK